MLQILLVVLPLTSYSCSTTVTRITWTTTADSISIVRNLCSSGCTSKFWSGDYAKHSWSPSHNCFNIDTRIAKATNPDVHSE